VSEDTKNQTQDDEIDLIEVALKLWAERRFILKVVLIFFVIGLVIAFGSKKEYKSEVSFILDDNQGGSRVSGLLAQFGGMAGINFSDDDSDGVISPEIYPNILKSTSFLLQIMEEEIYIQKYDTTVTVFYYLNNLDKPSFIGYIKKFTVGLPGLIIELFAEEQVNEVNQKETTTDIIELTKDEIIIMENLDKRISISLNEETGLVNLGIELPDAYAAAELTKISYDLLTKYLIDYKIDKATIDYDFINDRYEEAKKEFEKAQIKLAKYRDQNINVSSAYVKTREERLQNEYTVAFNIYNGLAQQLEQAKIKVQEKMPICRIINNIKVPHENIKPRRLIVITLTTFLGILVGLLVIILNKLVKKINVQ